MEVILLEGINRLGNIGDRATVKAGYARNYLFPRKMALPANKKNGLWVEQQRAELEATQMGRKSEAEQLAARIDSSSLEISALCGPEGQLHGSVTVADIVAAAAASGLELSKNMVKMPEQRIASAGEYEITVRPVVGIEANMKLTITPKAQA